MRRGEGGAEEERLFGEQPAFASSFPDDRHFPAVRRESPRMKGNAFPYPDANTNTSKYILTHILRNIEILFGLIHPIIYE